MFVGGPAQHNREAARFLDALGPRLGAWARVVIAGQCTRARAARNSGGAVRHLGYVEDLSGLYAAADIAVNPVPYGSGSSVKVAEYLAAGLPVVSTPVGMRGYEHLGARLAVAPLAEFADALARLRPTISGPTAPVREPTWTDLGRRLHDAYARLLGRGAR